ncbi:MAG TPA: RpiB/LacA/LacB family sugar-phosphate isomerase [Caulobacteraceae bacterium]|jgi:ribose 5-phosphate isomerase B|nr:RpiB/LacA/LacB family sugar-phosphate isomerase [Caulobacteraceae bacterium]
MSKTVIPIGADHRGYALKAQFIGWLEQNGYAPKDLGAHSPERCDALDYAEKLAAEFKSNPIQFGILICGSGQAMTMTANRYRHLRAALCGSVAMAKTTREHNDANVLVLGADFTPQDEALKILQAFLDTKFLGGRYAERRDALTALGGL